MSASPPPVKLHALKRLERWLKGKPTSLPAPVTPQAVCAPASPEVPATLDWQPGMIFERGDTAEAYAGRLIDRICADYPQAKEALALMLAEIDKGPDPEERAHTRMHKVRLLQTYAMVPQGPGSLVDVGASDIYAVPLRQLKGWDIQPVPILAIDYECDPLPYEDASQDVVMLCEVIEHFVIDPLFCLHEINRILKLGGALVLTTPNTASWFAVAQALNQKQPNRWAVYAGSGSKERNHIHAREYLVWELEGLLRAAGFDPEEVLTCDYGISPAYLPIPGFDTTHRGETIFIRARKVSRPVMRYVTPIYLRDEPA